MLDLQGKGDAPYATDLLSLDADGVHQLWTDLGYPHYHEQLHGPFSFTSTGLTRKGVGY